MGNDAAPSSSKTPLSRRAMLGGLGAGAGALGLGLAARPAAAATAATAGGPEKQSPIRQTAGIAINASAVQAGLDYLTFASWEFQAATSAQAWSVIGGTFRFTGTGAAAGLASVHPQLPVGSLLHEFEVYGSTAAGSVAEIEIWTEDITTGAINQIKTVVIPASTANFTATATIDPPLLITASLAVTPFVWITDSVAGATQIRGARVGYEPPTPTPAFVPLSPIPRPYNTRDTTGLTKLNPGEERTITLPVPAGVSAAVIQLTVTETGAGGFIGVFPADAASWPGNSSINWSAANSNVGGTVITAVDPAGKIKLRGGGSTTHVIIDVVGYLT